MGVMTLWELGFQPVALASELVRSPSGYQPSLVFDTLLPPFLADVQQEKVHNSLLSEVESEHKLKHVETKESNPLPDTEGKWPIRHTTRGAGSQSGHRLGNRPIGRQTATNDQ